MNIPRFSKSQLYLIEREFDRIASELSVGLAQFLKATESQRNNKQMSKHIQKVMEEHIKCFDDYRTISAVCELIRKEEAKWSENND